MGARPHRASDKKPVIQFLGAMLIAGAVWLCVPPAARLHKTKTARNSGPKNTHTRDVLLAATGFMIFPGLPGVVLCVAIYLALRKIVPLAQTRDAQRSNTLSYQDVVEWVDRMHIGLAAGASLHDTLISVKQRTSPRIHTCLTQYESFARAGYSAPVSLHRAFEDQPLANNVVRILARAHETGVPVNSSLHSIAVDLQTAHEAHICAQIRAVSVKAVLPLGLCFLPAFIAVTVIPLAGSLISGVFS
ncbi:MAG: type II secretion system F family protein [Actinomycetes bacterium]